MIKQLLGLFTTLILLMNSSLAANVTTAPKATATLASSCTISAIDISFGDITSATPITIAATGNLSVLCSNNLAYSIGISLGNNTGGVNRYLKGPKTTDLTDTIYFICRTNAFNGTSKSCTGGMWTTTAKVTGTGIGSNQDIPVYAFMTGGMYVPDNYTDTVVVTIGY